MLRLTACASLLLVVLCCSAQKKPASPKTPPYKFQKLTVTDLETKAYALDSSAPAVILADVGSTYITGNTKGGFSLVFKRKTRIHILNKNAYDEATIEIPLYRSGNSSETLDDIKGTTYNLENGAVTETKLTKENIFTEVHSRNNSVKKFTLPNVREGSVIEFEYTLKSDYLFNLQPWTFQHNIPALWSEYTLSQPQFLEYVYLSQGYLPFTIHELKESNTFFSLSDNSGTGPTERSSFSAAVMEHRWGIKNVPKLKEESFTSSIYNYNSKIEFQLSGLKEPYVPKSLMNTWPQVTDELLRDEDFGLSLSNANFWLKDDMQNIINSTDTRADKAKKIYAFVRDHITCTTPNGAGIHTKQSLKQVLKTGKGTVSEVNLLLTAMLRWADVDADPVMLSTKRHGFAMPLYPMLSRFNYIVCRAQIDGVQYWLDAAQPYLGFGKLPVDCYNGFAKVINRSAGSCTFSSDSLREGKITSLLLLYNAKDGWQGTISQSPGYYESYSLRKEILDKGEEQYFKRLQQTLSMNVNIANGRFDSLRKFDHPLAIKADLTAAIPTEDIVYISPMFSESIDENPFKSAERFYPVEMPYTFDKTYQLTLDVPPGYAVDELPKSVRMKMNEEGEGMFEYLISESGNRISMRTRLRLVRATYQPDEYEMLRQFYTMVVAKCKEQIVLKKKAQP